MALINESDITRALNLQSFNMQMLSPILMKVMQLNKINDVYESVSERRGIDFIDEMLKALKIEVLIDDKELKNIPIEGSFVALANHPYGGIDGLIMLKILAMTMKQRRPTREY